MIEHAYIHIPFCLRKCNYCSFVSGLSVNDKDKYIKALISEIKERYSNEPLKTLYIGGGTPSMLEPKDINTILNCFNLEKCEEITLEANPETVNEEKFKKLKQIGINRISLGVQTFDNNILKLIGRLHNEKTIYNAVNIIKNAGFNNISIDLIYGLPEQTLELFKEDLEKAINLNIQHISTYGLKIEENSFFSKNPPKNLPDDGMQAQMYLYLCNTLKNNGFNHYEISNFSKENCESRHNLCYWRNKNYYGFGLNASGYQGNIRYKNTSDFDEYINNPLKREEETALSEEQIKEEEIFLALRTQNGIDINKLEPKHKNIIEKYKKLNLLKEENNHIKLTKQGILVSNEIMAEFID